MECRHFELKEWMLLISTVADAGVDSEEKLFKRVGWKIPRQMFTCTYVVLATRNA